MRVLPRTQFGNPILRTKAKDVSLKSIRSPKMRALAQEMIYTMRRVGGVGIAAPQIGKASRIAVMEMRPTDTRPDLERKGPIVLFNPRITKHSAAKEYGWEGCLSLPAVRGSVPRSKSVTVEYYDGEGQKVVEHAEGLWAYIFQHEIDHLDGTLYVDRMKDMSTLMSLGEYKKRILKKA